MSRSLRSAAAIIVALACSTAAHAGSAIDRASTVSAFALPIELAPTVTPTIASGDAALAGTSVSGPRLESIRYRPRRRPRNPDREDYGTRSTGFTQIHGGFFDLEGDPPSAFLFGVRGGTSIEEKIQLGVNLDLSHRSDKDAVVLTEVPLPGGGTAERRTVLAESSTNLLPMMVFLQVTPGVDMPIAPYFGIAGGYEVLFLSAEDFTTGDEYDATFGGWAWQAWGGVAMPLSGRTRLMAEVFLNNGDLERDVDDPDTGQSFREIVSVDGAGMRFGLSWGF